MSDPTIIRYALAPEDAELLPKQAHPGDAGYDLRSRVDMTLAPGEFKGVPTGVRLEMPMGWMAEVRPRSGLALRSGITVLNTPGTIDAGYRGEIQAILINHSTVPFEIHRGDRIAQLLFQRVPSCTLVAADELTESERGAGGFGSTGTR